MPTVADVAKTLVLIVAILGSVAGCGDDKSRADGAGSGGATVPGSGGGDGTGGAVVGSGGARAGGGGGGAAGAAGADGSGGTAGTPGSGGGPAATGGQAAGGDGGHGGAGGADPCAGEAACAEGAARCNGAAPQSCQRDGLGCTFWGTPPGQPAVCSANQTCVAATATCACDDDPRCGTPPATGDFCPTDGGSTHASCNLTADGCFTVSEDIPCAAGLVCVTSRAGALVSTGSACGCPPPLDDQTGRTARLLGTACTDAQAAAGARVGSAMDEAVLICKPSGSCNTWQVFVACQSQQLTGGTDPVTSRPACVCPAPMTAHQYYVDPDPAMATFMTGPPTGAQFPAACRYRTLTTALGQPGVTEVIAAHESSSNVHFKTLRGTPAVSNCNAANTCESFPLEIPPGVHVYTSDEGSFNPAHYVIDVDRTSQGYALLLDDGAFLQGFTVNASGANPSGVDAGAGVAAVVASPLIGGWTGTQAAAPITARLDQVLILSSAAATGSGQTALLIQGQARWTATFLSIVGGANTARGIVIDHATDPVSGTIARLVASHLAVSVTGGAGQIAIELGTHGRANGVSSGPGPLDADAGNVLAVTNDAALDGAGAFTPHRLTVGSRGVGVHVFDGSATVTGVDVAGGPLGFVGYQIDGSNTPAAMGVVLHQGSISGAGTTGGGVGIVASGGLVTLDGVHVTGADGWTGVSVRQTAGDASRAGDVTITGTADVPTVIDVVTPLGATTAPAGIQVGLGDERTTFDVTAPPPGVALPRLTLLDDALVTHYLDGVVVNNGHVVASGPNVQIARNLRDGLQVLSSLALAGTDPGDLAARASFTGTSFTGNGRAGVLLRGVAPVLLDAVSVTGNGTPLAGSALPAFPDGTGGIDVQRSQLGANGTVFPAVIVDSVVSGNVGCGITLSGGGDDLVNRSTATDGVRVCGLGTGFGVDGSPTGTAAGRVPGPVPGVRPGDAATESPPPRGIFGGRTNVGGKVSAFIKNTRVQDNTGVGIYVTEARDLDPALAGDDVTDVSLQDNLVTGNLTMVSPVGLEPVAGGIYFATSNLTVTDGVGRPAEVSDLGCEDPQAAAIDHAGCTRVRMASFLGNVVSCNGRAQMAFALPQRTSASASGVSPDGDWDISSDGTIVGLNLAMRCADAASPNTIAGYSASAANIGLGVPAAASTAEGVSLVHVGAYGVKWNAGAIVAGSDYAAGLARPPQGNGDFTRWGVCPAVTPVSCPVTSSAP